MASDDSPIENILPIIAVVITIGYLFYFGVMIDIESNKIDAICENQDMEVYESREKKLVCINDNAELTEYFVKCDWGFFKANCKPIQLNKNKEVNK